MERRQMIAAPVQSCPRRSKRRERDRARAEIGGRLSPRKRPSVRARRASTREPPKVPAALLPGGAEGPQAAGEEVQAAAGASAARSRGARATTGCLLSGGGGLPREFKPLEAARRHLTGGRSSRSVFSCARRRGADQAAGHSPEPRSLHQRSQGGVGKMEGSGDGGGETGARSCAGGCRASTRMRGGCA